MVLFLISNYTGINTGRGGHYYSLRQMAESIAKHKEVITIVIGSEIPRALIGMDRVYYVSTKIYSQKGGLRKALNILRELNFLSKLSVVHIYDSNSVYIGASIAKIARVNFLLTKCGGGVPKKSYAKVNSLIVFHEADYNYFNSYKGCYRNVHLIPNRVKATVFCEKRTQQIETIKDEDSFNIIKIGRISKYYYKTLTDTIRFCSELSKLNYPIKLTFIGYQESSDIIKKINMLAQELNVNLTIHTGSAYTFNASELVWACDAAIGTGRGAMEVLSAGKILLFPVDNFDYPCLFNEETAPYAMRDNFSERVTLPTELSEYCNPNHVMDLLKNSSYVTSLKKFGIEVFNSSFNVDVGARKVIDVYNDIDIYDDDNTISFFTKLGLIRLQSYAVMSYLKYKLKAALNKKNEL